MNVCFFLGGFYGNGGIGRVTSVLAGRLAQEPDFTVTALSYLRRDEKRLYPLSERVHEAFFLDRYESMTKVMLTGGERRLRRFLKEHDVDVLVACGALFFPISVRAARGTQTKVVCWLIGLLLFSLLVIAYGAIGKEGLHSVRQTLPTVPVDTRAALPAHNDFDKYASNQKKEKTR